MRLIAASEERLTDEALASALSMTTDEIRTMRPISAPQHMFGAEVGPKETWTVGEVLNIDRSTPTYRSWTSGPNVPNVPVYDKHWQGSMRNFNEQSGL